MFCMRGIERDFFIFYFWLAIVIGSALMAFISRIFFYIFFPQEQESLQKCFNYTSFFSRPLSHTYCILSAWNFFVVRKEKEMRKTTFVII